MDQVHAICKRFSSIIGTVDDDSFNDEDDSCEGLPSHAVTPTGFLLLRQAESLTGLLVHKVERIEKCFHTAFSGISGSLLTSLASLVCEQEQAILSLDLFHINCNTREESLARIFLLQQYRTWSISFLDVKSHSLGADGWSGLARAVSRGSIVCLSTEREVMVEGRREDLKVVWDASTRWNMDGRFIDREIFWGLGEADTKVGWQIIEDLLWQAEPSAGPIIDQNQEYVEFDKNCAKECDMKILAKASSAKKLGDLLHKDHDFTDVTLVCADGHQVSCHRAVLAAASPFLCKLLYQSLQQKTFIILGVGVEVGEVEALVELIYLGRTNLVEARLSPFKALTRELQLDNELLFQEEFQERGEQIDKNVDLKEEWSSEEKYPCKEDDLRKGVQESEGVGKKKVAKCPRCGIDVSLKSLNRHILRNHTEGDHFKVACKDCKKIFKDKSHLMNHTKRKQCRADPEKWPLLCGRGCGLRFRTLHTMERHQRKNCPVKLQCEKCPQNFSKFRQLTKHRSLCIGEVSYEVPFGEDDDEEVMVTMFMEEEDALAELEKELRGIE